MTVGQKLCSLSRNQIYMVIGSVRFAFANVEFYRTLFFERKVKSLRISGDAVTRVCCSRSDIDCSVRTL